MLCAEEFQYLSMPRVFVVQRGIVGIRYTFLRNNSLRKHRLLMIDSYVSLSTNHAINGHLQREELLRNLLCLVKLRMEKHQRPPSDTKLPEPLNVLAKRMGNGISENGSIDRKAALKELLLTSLMQPKCQPEFLPPFRNLCMSDNLDDKLKKFSEELDQTNINKQSEETLKTGIYYISNHFLKDDTEERMEEGKGEAQCLCNLMDGMELSLDGEWLRKHLELPLKMAMREIVSRKPYNPVNYLGFWLLNYKQCQESNRWQLERQQQLDYIRSLVQEPIYIDEEHVSVAGGEEEEETRDWNFKYYESWHTPM